MGTKQPETLNTLMYNIIRNGKFNEYDKVKIPCEIMKLIQKEGFDVNEQDEYGYTALHLLIIYDIYLTDENDDHSDSHKSVAFVLAEYLLKNFYVDFSLKNSVNRTVLDQLRGNILSLTIDMENETIYETWQLLNNRRIKILSLLFLFKLYEIKQETENPINQSTLICFEHFSEYKEDLFADVFEMIADMNIIKARDYMIRKSIDSITFSKNFTDIEFYDGIHLRDYVFDN